MIWNVSWSASFLFEAMPYTVEAKIGEIDQ